MVTILYFLYLFMLFCAGFTLINYFLQLVGYYGMFKKIGLEKWKSLLPLYNTYTVYKKVWNKYFYFLSWLPGILSYVAVLAYGYSENGEQIFPAVFAFVVICTLARYVFYGIYSYKVLIRFSYSPAWLIAGVIFRLSAVMLLCGYGKHAFIERGEG